MTGLTLLTLGAYALRGLQYLSCVCVSVYLSVCLSVCHAGLNKKAFSLKLLRYKVRSVILEPLVFAQRTRRAQERSRAIRISFPTAPPSAGFAAYCRSPSCGQQSSASEALVPPVAGLRGILSLPRTWHPQRPGVPTSSA